MGGPEIGTKNQNSQPSMPQEPPVQAPAGELALNGEIPKKLSKLKPLQCSGCLFGVMTRLPWRGKELAFSHEILVATKPGEIVSVDQMEST